MSLSCQTCGAQLPDGAVYCGNCGAVVQNAAPEQQFVYANEQPVTQPQPQYIPPQYSEPQYVQPQYQQPQYQEPQYQMPMQPVQPEPKAKNEEKLYPVAGVGGFFWRTILFAIPIVGLICCIVMAFAPRNPNVRNHARAYCLFWIIAAAILLTLVIIAAITGASLFSALSNGYY